MHLLSFQVNSDQQQLQNVSIRMFSAKEPLTLKMIQERVILVLNLYDKIDPSKVGLLLIEYYGSIQKVIFI
jgi:NADH dehydrogenase (ubiquinone) 1 alpha/beta subcomplex 1